LKTKALIRLTGVNSAIAGAGPARNSFAEFLARKGLLASSIEMNIRRIVCIDYSPKFGSEISHPVLDLNACTLVRMEPSVVLPANFSRSRSKQFGTEITVGGKPTGASSSVHWPLVFPTELERSAFLAAERSERVVLINGNKMSFVAGELYSLRRKSIRAFENLDLYGTEWDSTLLTRLFVAIRSLAHAALSLKVPSLNGINLWFQSYPKSKGPVKDKLATMSKYRYALVIENSTEYMSEKLMEALFAGCIPIYVGPDPQAYGIPDNLVIWTKPDIGSIRSSLADATNWDYLDFRSRLDLFVSSSATRELWDSENVYQKMLDMIQSAS
jgi:hypothetical protein